MLQQRFARNDDEDTKDSAVSWGEDAKKEAKKQRRATSDGARRSVESLFGC
jgi:hypothetical protein